MYIITATAAVMANRASINAFDSKRDKLLQRLHNVKPFDRIYSPNNYCCRILPSRAIFECCNRGDIEGLSNLLSSIDNTNRALICCVQNSNIPVLNHLLNNGANIHYNADQLFIEAITQSDCKFIQLLLENGADLRARNDAALFYSARRGDKTIVKLLVEKGIGLHSNVGSELFISVQENHYDVTKYLLKHHVMLPDRKKYAQMLRWCVKMDSVQTLSLLLKYNDNADTTEAINESAIKNNIVELQELINYNKSWSLHCSYDGALEVACGHGHTTMVQLLLELGARVQPKARSMQFAALNGHCDIISQLIRCDTLARASQTTTLALAIAAGRGHEEIVRILLLHGAIVGDSAICWAACEAHIEIIMLLIEYGGKIASDIIDWAVDSGSPAIVKLFLERGYHIGDDAIDRAVQMGYIAVTALLLEHGSHAHIGTHARAVALAVDIDYLELVQLLLEHGATIPEDCVATACYIGNIKIVRLLLEWDAIISKNCVELACCNGHTEIVCLLLEYGANISKDCVKCACKIDNQEIVKLLLGAHMHTRAHAHAHVHISGGAVEYAAIKGNTTMVKILLEHGARIKEGVIGRIIENAHGNYNFCTKAIALLVESGAIVTEQTLALACRKKQISQSIIKLLLDTGTSISAKALENACYAGNYETVKVLLEHGASVSVTEGAIEYASTFNDQKITKLLAKFSVIKN